MIAGMLRIKSEQRWIAKVLESILPLCDEIVILDDHSEDDTVSICRSFPNVTVYESHFEGLNENRDKQWLLEKVQVLKPEHIIAIDGDEILAPGYQDALREAMKGPYGCLSLRIWYLWNDWNTVRVDGCYGDFHRESVFRPNGSTFTVNGNGANFHCGNVPFGNRINKRVLHQIPLLHTGYMHQEDRARKCAWYRENDPQNAREDNYTHLTQGDPGGAPASARLMHGGPLRLEPLEVCV